MSKQPRGRKLSLPVGRRLVAELMHHARKVPTLPLARTCCIAELVAARQEANPQPSWMALFIRAYGLLSQEMAPLRRAWIPFPWAHLYEHPTSECAVLLERLVEGEPTVLAAHLRNPEYVDLLSLDAHLRRYRERPVEEVTAFRQLLRLGRLPWLLRRFFLWRVLNTDGYRRATRLGTFVISSLGNFGVEQMHPLTALTTYFTFGPISADGTVTLKIIYDHRVLDGRTVARALVRLEELLNTTVLAELRSLEVSNSAR
jgi:hypothetical protein